MEEVYNYLRDVKVIKKSQPIKNSWLWHSEPEVDHKSPELWVAVYHKIHKKWIVTNDLTNSGLNDKAENITIIGQADNIDGIMFVVWEHQESLGLSYTVLDEIRKHKKSVEIKANDSEWAWAKTKEAQMHVSSGGFTSRLTIKGLELSDVKWTLVDEDN